ncbi:FAD-binding oxidoreductase [uncultured Shewanella sp.]|uniref:FAD-binding oxidoreductase n=1 Tax=uncultured Shewanella sp. TaxID=173975 RepID=UPI0026301918|nr:FAD-binding oxidoreductase [uncultured Shewanella sp.]
MISIKNLQGDNVDISPAEFQHFTSKLDSRLLFEGCAEYEQSRQIFNHIFNRKPAFIIKPSGAADIQTTVKFAAKHQLLIAIKSGGHNVAGHASCEGGILIDLSLMQSIHVDTNTQQVRVEAGALLHKLDHETQSVGLAVPVGVVSVTGVAGLTLGGGFGWLTGKYGLAIDNLISAQLITSDGEIRDISKNNHVDLFWAIRGGSGNFGIITSFLFQAHPVGPDVLFCSPLYALEKAETVLVQWRDFMTKASQDLTSVAFIYRVPVSTHFPEHLHNQDVVMLAGVHIGKQKEAKKHIQNLCSFDGLLHDATSVMPFEQVQQWFENWNNDDVQPQRFYFKSIYTNQLDKPILKEFINGFRLRPLSTCKGNVSFVIQCLRGAFRDVPEEDTAFGSREPHFMLESNLAWIDAHFDDANIAWGRALWDRLAAYSNEHRIYINHSGVEEDHIGQLPSVFGKNYNKLRKIKKKYDPMNLFRQNANIPPAD